MSVVWKIALRNLREHRVKTLIIGMIITLGIAVLVVGNSLMDTAAEGIRRTYTSSYTGDFMVTGVHRGSLTLFGMQDIDSFDAVIPEIPSFDEVVAFAEQHPEVVATSPQAAGLAMVDYEENRSYMQLFGIDPAAYQRMFPESIEILEGRFLAPGEEGILLNAQTAFELERNRALPLEPGELVLLTGMNELSGVKVREVPVRGIFRFRYSNPQLDMVSLIDIGNVRSLAGMNLAKVNEAELSEEEAALFDVTDADALFGGEDELSSDEDALFGTELIESVDVVSGESLDESLVFTPMEPSAPQRSDEASNAWHFLLVDVRDGADPARVAADFQRFFSERGIAATTSDWLSGAGALAGLAHGMKSMFNIVILVIAVVGIIIIMNTLVISVTERITEIGTMRALGAQKRFVRRMIACETLITSGVFGLLGVAVGCILLWVLNATGLEAPNVFFEILFGGKVLHPVPSVGAILTSLGVVVVIGLIASVYPTSIALKIKPVKAMQGS